MMFGQNREQLRRFYHEVWRKQAENTPLEGLESIVAQVIAQHPEYHILISDPEAVYQDFDIELGQTNPFLHMGMHIALAEQLQADRPVGIRKLHQKISQRVGEIHAAEHQMMECLGLTLWEAQRNKEAPDEQTYLACLKKLTRK